MSARRLAGSEEARDETVASRVALDIVGVDVERKRNDSVAGTGQRRSRFQGIQTHVPMHMAPSR